MKERFLKVAFKGIDIDVHVSIHGADDLPKQILCLHGFGTDGNSFNNLADNLSCSYNLVMIDWIGFGKSSKPLRKRDTYNHEYLTAFLVAFIEKALKEHILRERFNVLAYSMSGLMIGRAYERIKEHVDKIIFANPGGFDKNISLKFSMVMANPLLKKETFIKLITKNVFWKRFLGLTNKDRAKFWSKIGSGEFEVYLRCINSSMTMRGKVKDTHIFKKYHEINVPVIMIASKNDTLIIDQEYLKAAEKHGWAVIKINHNHHMMLASKSKEIAKAIKMYV